MKHTFIILDDETESVLRTLSVVARFPSLHFVGSATSGEEGLNLILEHQPALVFLEISPKIEDHLLSLQLISELHRFLDVLPKIIVTTTSKELAYEAMKYGAVDFLLKPINTNDVRKLVMHYEKSFSRTIQQPNIESSQHLPIIENRHSITTVVENENSNLPVVEVEEDVKDNAIDQPIAEQEVEIESADLPAENEPVRKVVVEDVLSKEEKPLIICVKSYGDYRFIEAKDICYLQADNNSTDIHLFNGEMITAFKTLKHFENVLSVPFVRIHNSYIVNMDYVSRIHTGNSVCYIKNTTTKLPFSKSYKENVDAIINSIAKGNYLEI